MSDLPRRVSRPSGRHRALRGPLRHPPRHPRGRRHHRRALRPRAGASALGCRARTTVPVVVRQGRVRSWGTRCHRTAREPMNATTGPHESRSARQRAECPPGPAIGSRGLSWGSAWSSGGPPAAARSVIDARDATATRSPRAWARHSSALGSRPFVSANPRAHRETGARSGSRPPRSVVRSAGASMPCAPSTEHRPAGPSGSARRSVSSATATASPSSASTARPSASTARAVARSWSSIRARARASTADSTTVVSDDVRPCSPARRPADHPSTADEWRTARRRARPIVSACSGASATAAPSRRSVPFHSSGVGSANIRILFRNCGAESQATVR